MKALIRLFVVLNLAASLVVLVVHLDRHYAPRTAQQWQRWVGPPPQESADQPPLGEGVPEPVGQPSVGNHRPLPPGSTDRATNDKVRAGLPSPARNGEDALHALPLATPDLRRCFWPADPDPAAQSLAEAPLAPVPGGPPQPLPRGLDQEASPMGRRSPRAQQPVAAPSAELADRLRHPGRPSAAEDHLNGLVAADSFDLLWQLQGADQQSAVRLRSELQRRGCTEVHLELAGRLFDKDPEVRKALAQALPKLQSVDAAPWLLRLSRDEDADVRVTAITLLATTGDPALLQQAESIAQRDPDARIREQAERISRQRELAGNRGAVTGPRGRDVGGRGQGPGSTANR